MITPAELAERIRQHGSAARERRGHHPRRRTFSDTCRRIARKWGFNAPTSVSRAFGLLPSLSRPTERTLVHSGVRSRTRITPRRSLSVNSSRHPERSNVPHDNPNKTDISPWQRPSRLSAH